MKNLNIGTVSYTHLDVYKRQVQNFESKKYLGKWSEIARFDSRFERNMNNVTATYSLKDNGNIKVDNKGFDYVKKEWKESIGEAKFVNEPTEARLKVSFFKPIWAGYNVIDLDENYKYALVAGNNLDYLWILSREKTFPEGFNKRFLVKPKNSAYKRKNSFWVKNNCLLNHKKQLNNLCWPTSKF